MMTLNRPTVRLHGYTKETKVLLSSKAILVVEYIGNDAIRGSNEIKEVSLYVPFRSQQEVIIRIEMGDALS